MKNHKIKVVLILLQVVLFIGCTKKLHTSGYTELEQIKQSFSTDYFDTATGSTMKYSSIFYIARYKGLTIYQIPVTVENTTIKSENNRYFIGDTILSTSTEFQYYVWRDAAPGGVLLTQNNSTFTKSEFDVTAFLKKKKYKKEMFFDKLNDSLVETKYDKQNEVVRKIYCPRIRKDNSYPDSTILTFSGKSSFKYFTLCNEIDSAFNMKLISALFIYNPYFETVSQKKIDRREMKVALDLCDLKNKNIIKSLTDSLAGKLKKDQAIQ